jgi:hypothetical protein
MMIGERVKHNRPGSGAGGPHARAGLILWCPHDEAFKVLEEESGITVEDSVDVKSISFRFLQRTSFNRFFFSVCSNFRAAYSSIVEMH